MIGIEREYNELDTVWFMAGSLFQVRASAVHSETDLPTASSCIKGLLSEAKMRDEVCLATAETVAWTIGLALTSL